MFHGFGSLHDRAADSLLYVRSGENTFLFPLFSTVFFQEWEMVTCI